MEHLDSQKLDFDLSDVEKQVTTFSTSKILAAFNSSKKIIIASNIGSFLMTASCGLSENLRKETSAIITGFKLGQISSQDASLKFQKSLKLMIAELKEDALLKNFGKAKKTIITIMHIADVLEEKDLRKKLSTLFLDTHSFYDKLDLTKTGIFVDDEKNKIYFIDEIVLPVINNPSLKKVTIETKIKEAAIEQIEQFCSQNKIKYDPPLFFTLSHVVMANRSDDERVVQFLFEVNGVYYGSDDRINITQNIISTLSLKQQVIRLA